MNPRMSRTSSKGGSFRQQKFTPKVGLQIDIPPDVYNEKDEQKQLDIEEVVEQVYQSMQSDSDNILSKVIRSEKTVDEADERQKATDQNSSIDTKEVTNKAIEQIEEREQPLINDNSLHKLLDDSYV